VAEISSLGMLEGKNWRWETLNKLALYKALRGSSFASPNLERKVEGGPITTLISKYCLC
jgi:hypothetical protein